MYSIVVYSIVQLAIKFAESQLDTDLKRCTNSRLLIINKVFNIWHFCSFTHHEIKQSN